MKLLIILALCVLGTQAGTRIINGQESPLLPYHAHLLIRPTINSPQVFVGSGAVISLTHVLTVAQNARGYLHWQIGVGHVQRAQLRFFDSFQAIIHPEYNWDNLNNNIAILVLAAALPSGDITISAIPLPLITDNTPMENELGTISGFGFTTNTGSFSNVLLRGFQRVVSTAVCTTAYPHLNPFMANHFCGRDDAAINLSNICGGDQGGPFTVILRSFTTLVGLASFTNNICDGGFPAAFVRVATYRAWIQTQAGI